MFTKSKSYKFCTYLNCTHSYRPTYSQQLSLSNSIQEEPQYKTLSPCELSTYSSPYELKTTLFQCIRQISSRISPCPSYPPAYLCVLGLSMDGISGHQVYLSVNSSRILLFCYFAVHLLGPSFRCFLAIN